MLHAIDPRATSGYLDQSGNPRTDITSAQDYKCRREVSSLFSANANANANANADANANANANANASILTKCTRD